MTDANHDKCRQVREMLSGFLDDELSCDVSHGIQEHLDRCPPCAKISKVDQAFNSTMKARVRRIEAPDHFASAVMARLERGEWNEVKASSPPLPRRRVLKRAGYALAAAAVLVLVLAPVAARFMPGFLQNAADALSGVRTVSGVLVCVECEKQGAPMPHQRLCRLEGHHTGFRSSDNGIWNLVVNDASLPLMSDPSLRGTRVTVEGRFLNDIRYVDARRITLDAESKSRANTPSWPCAAQTGGSIIPSWEGTSSSSMTRISPRRSWEARPPCSSTSPRNGAAPARSSTRSSGSYPSPTRAG